VKNFAYRSSLIKTLIALSHDCTIARSHDRMTKCSPFPPLKKNLTRIRVKRKFVLINLSTDLFRPMEIPEYPQNSRECKLKNLRVSISKKRTMKKFTLLIAVFCLVAINAIAQPPQLAKGKIMLGSASTIATGGGWGSDLMGLGFTKSKHKEGSTSEDNSKMTAYNLLPKGGYFIIDNLVAGLELVVSGYKEVDVDDNDTRKESMFAAGPYVRYYYPLKKIYPFAEIEALFGTQKDDWYGIADKAGTSLISGLLGVAVPIGDKVTFDALAGYSHYSETWKYEDGTDEYKYVSGGLVIRLGFSIYL
jgi:hypothetical protein